MCRARGFGGLWSQPSWVLIQSLPLTHHRWGLGQFRCRKVTLSTKSDDAINYSKHSLNTSWNRADTLSSLLILILFNNHNLSVHFNSISYFMTMWEFETIVLRPSAVCQLAYDPSLWQHTGDEMRWFAGPPSFIVLSYFWGGGHVVCLPTPTMSCVHSHVGEEIEKHGESWIYHTRMPPIIFLLLWTIFSFMFVTAAQLTKRTILSMRNTDADSLDETAWWIPSSWCESHSWCLS